MAMATMATWPMGPTASTILKIDEMSSSGSLMIGSSQSAFAGWSKNGMGTVAERSRAPEAARPAPFRGDP
jgi:hypothetical protein